MRAREKYVSYLPYAYNTSKNKDSPTKSWTIYNARTLMNIFHLIPFSLFNEYVTDSNLPLFGTHASRDVVIAGLCTFCTFAFAACFASVLGTKRHADQRECTAPFENHTLHACIVPLADDHQNHYTPLALTVLQSS